MLTFILSVALVSFICLCFFKKNFWENRYLVLLISGGVALVATLTINFLVRGKLQTKTEVMWTKPMAVFYMPEDLILGNVKYSDVNDSLHSTIAKINIIKNYDWYGDHKASEFYKNIVKRDTVKKDTLKKQRQFPVTIILYSWGKRNQYQKVGIMTVRGNQNLYYLNEIYFAESSADTIAYICRKKLYYDVKPNNWITGFSIPPKSAITILYVPPKEFKMIPDSLIRKIPF
jgi:hypothetical protein